jgi:hypothetical protein
VVAHPRCFQVKVAGARTRRRSPRTKQHKLTQSKSFRYQISHFYKVICSQASLLPVAVRVAIRMPNRPPSPSTNTHSSPDAVHTTPDTRTEQTKVTQPLIPSPGTEDVESDYGDLNELDFTDIAPTCEQNAIGTATMKTTEAATNEATVN